MHIVSSISRRLSGPTIGSILFFCYMPFLAKSLGPEEYSIFSYMLQSMMALSSLIILRSDFSILYKKSKNQKNIHFLPIAVFFLTTPLLTTLFIITSNLIYLLSLLFNIYLILHAMSVSNNDMLSIGLSELSYKVSLIVVSFLFLFFNQNIIFSILIALIIRIAFLSKNLYLFFLTKDIFNLRNRINDFLQIKWWSASQCIMILGGYLPFISIASLYDDSLFGFYLLSVTILFGISALAGKGIADVVFEYTANVSRLRSVMKKIYMYSFFIFAITFVIYLYADKLIIYIMGENWDGFHEVSIFVLFIAYASFLSNCFDKFPQYYGHESYSLIFNILRLALNISLLFASILFKLDFYQYLLWLSISNIGLYLFDVIYVYKIVKKNDISH